MFHSILIDKLHDHHISVETDLKIKENNEEQLHRGRKVRRTTEIKVSSVRSGIKKAISH